MTVTERADLLYRAVHDRASMTPADWRSWGLAKAEADRARRDAAPSSPAAAPAATAPAARPKLTTESAVATTRIVGAFIRGESGDTDDDHLALTRAILAHPGVAAAALVRFARQSNERNRERSAAIASLEARVAALEARPTKSMNYCGIWNQGRIYEEGDVCTVAGALWHASARTEERPGDGKTAWTMITKSRR